MYKEAKKDLWSGRVDNEDKELGRRWHEKVEFLSYPYKKTSGIALLGFACDEGVKRNKGRTGSFNAPDKLKSAMGNFAHHLNSKLYDLGNIEFDDDLEKTQDLLALHVKTLLENNHLPIVVGGGHEIAYGSFKGIHQHFQDEIAIINFDAHFDLRQNELATSGTPFFQINELCQKDNTRFSYMCLGISKAANTKALYEKAKTLNVKHIEDTQMTYKKFDFICHKIEDFLKEKKYIYITIDTDVFSSYLNPAVSAQSGRGVNLDITYDILEYVFKNYNEKIKLVDFAEFNPKYDIQDMGLKNISRLVFDVVSLVDNYLNI